MGKVDSLFHQRIKPVKLRWTQAWRRMNKKGKVDEHAKKRTRKVQKFQKAIVGMSLEDIKKKKAQKPELRQAAKEAAAKEAKAHGKGKTWLQGFGTQGQGSRQAFEEGHAALSVTLPEINSLGLARDEARGERSAGAE